jgi:soluble lytic murein transglycosylase
LLITLLSSGCERRELWAGSEALIREDFRRGDFARLTGITVAEEVARESLRLGPGAPYYLYFVFKERQREEEALLFLESVVRWGTGIWREEGAHLLGKILLERDALEEAESWMRLFLQKTGDPSPRVKKLHIEALYWQHRDREVLDRLEREFTPDDFAEIPELLLFRAVSSTRLEITGGSDDFRRLFLTVPASNLHIRAYRFLTLEPARLSAFSAAYQKLFEGKWLLASGRRQEAILALEESLPGLEPPPSQPSTLVRELALAFLYANRSLRGAEFLDTLMEELSPQWMLDALEMAGRLYRNGGNREAAGERFRTASRMAPEGRQRDRNLWHLLGMSIERSHEEALMEVERTYSRWSDPGYFSDLLERIVTTQASRGDIAGMQRLYRTIDRGGPGDVRARLQFLLSPGDRRKGGPVAYSLWAAPVTNAQKSSSYYALLSLPMMAQPGWGSGETTAHKEEGKGELDAFITGFFDYALYGEAALRIKEHGEKLGGETLLHGALRLAEQGYHTEAIRILDGYVTQEGHLPGEEGWKTAYPLAFEEHIGSAAEEQELSPFLLYALIREESYFDPDIESSAGAVGLTQLMPRTAQEMADRLDLDNPDLTDPYENLALGSAYLGRLYRVLGNIPKTLMAYNAGLSRVRSWERQFPGVPNELFVEMIPFQETRHYIRKVLVATVIYAALYGKREPAEILSLFFPGYPTPAAVGKQQLLP